MVFNKKIGVYALMALSFSVFVGQGSASAQVASPVSASCVSINTSLRYGSSDYYTGGAVTQLQQFLVGQGYFNSAYLGTGRFGSLTARAVVQYQAAHGVPATGFMGPLTRAAIYNQTCGGVVIPPVSTGPSLYSMAPTSGPVGTQVSVTGFGFTNSNTILIDGMVAAQNVPISSSIAVACTTDPSCRGGIRQTLVFTVPSYLSPNCAANSMCPMYVRSVTAGNYQVSVQNTSGASNTQTFAVTDSTTNTQKLSVMGIDAPPTLPLGTPGTWTVHVSTGGGTGTLHYSVVWGDEANSAAIMAPQSIPVQSYASFTHTYQRSGTYTPRFTVSDDNGNTVTVSSSIVVTPLY